MKKSIIWIVIIIIIIVIIALVYKGNSTPSTSTNQEPVATTTVQIQPVTPMVALGTASSTKLGAFLVAPNGMTLYHLTLDSVGTTTCYGSCAALWPAYTVETSASGYTGGAMATGSISTITRTDGTNQVTYNGVPLYFYSKDVKVGDTKGQNVGKVWFVVKP